MPDNSSTDPQAPRRSQWWNVGLLVAAAVLLVPVAIIGAVLSYAAQYEAVAGIFGPDLGRVFPLQVDLFIAGASLAYIASALVGRPRQGWRIAAHVGVLLTLILNALTAQAPGDILWHLVPPAAWAACVELTAHHVLGEWRVAHEQPRDRIPLRLWISAPLESARTWLVMSRLDLRCHAEARAHVGLHAAAREALRVGLPKRSGRRVRRVLKRQLRAGSLTPAQVLAPLGWMNSESSAELVAASEVLRQTLIGVLAPTPVAELPPPRTQARRRQTATPGSVASDVAGAIETPSRRQLAPSPETSQGAAGRREPQAADETAPSPLIAHGGLAAVPRQQPAPEIPGTHRPLTVALADEHRPSVVSEKAWRWWVQARRAGRLPNEKGWLIGTGAARSTAGRWRRACEAVEAQLQVEAVGSVAEARQDFPVDAGSVPVGVG